MNKGFCLILQPHKDFADVYIFSTYWFLPLQILGFNVFWVLALQRSDEYFWVSMWRAYIPYFLVLLILSIFLPIFPVQFDSYYTLIFDFFVFSLLNILFVDIMLFVSLSFICLSIPFFCFLMKKFNLYYDLFMRWVL